jgi:deoxyribonuclease-4
MERLKVLHINDSQNELNTRKDRHDHIGSGFIGLEGFSNLVNDKRMHGKALILETPKGPDNAEDVENMMVLRGLVQGG